MHYLPYFLGIWSDGVLTNKYTKEYRIETEKDNKGKVHEKSVYIGPLFLLKTEEKKKRKIIFRMSVLSIVSLALFVSGLWNHSVFMHVFYISIPSICLGIMVYFYVTGCFYLWGRKEKYTREQKDKSGDRIKVGGMIGLLLGGGTLLCVAVNSILYRPELELWDIYYLVTIALQTIAAGFAYWNGKQIVFEEVKNRKV